MVEADRASLRVRTPEGVAFSFMLATPVTRLAAWLVDKGTIITAWSIISVLIGFLKILSHDVGGAVTVIGYFVVSTGYGIVLEWHWQGQTLGKRLLGLRVMDERGLPLRFSQVVVRNLLRVVDALPVAYLFGGLAALVSRKAQRLGDIAAATIVIHDVPVEGHGPAGLELSKYNSLRGRQHLSARLRAGTSPALAQAALQALQRRDRLESSARLVLFAELADHFRGLIGGGSPELTEDISDEQLVRNAVEVVFGAKPSSAPDRRISP